MENWKELIPYKSYNWFGNVVLTLFFSAAGICIGIAADMKAISNLRCNPNKNLALSQKAYVEASCSLHYEQKYHSPVPLYRFVVLNFGIVLSFCIFYAYAVKSRIESLDRSLDRSTTTDDDAGLQLHEALIEQRSQSNQENRPKPCILRLYFSFAVRSCPAHDTVCCFGFLSCKLSNRILLSFASFEFKHSRVRQRTSFYDG